jgi:hypothetical protein
MVGMSKANWRKQAKAIPQIVLSLSLSLSLEVALVHFRLFCSFHLFLNGFLCSLSLFANRSSVVKADVASPDSSLSHANWKRSTIVSQLPVAVKNLGSTGTLFEVTSATISADACSKGKRSSAERKPERDFRKSLDSALGV